MGGQVERPTYEQVCSGRTGHVEVVRITFDPSRISFADLLEIFFGIHDPTTPDRQGNDVGTQYRSVIFYTSSEQKRVAEETIRALTQEGAFPAPIVTTVEPAGAFYVAEDYHQEYFENNPNQPYCRAIVGPKVRKAMEKFADKLAQ
jgi:peptide-methionine (S)-S-oxide reductase